MARVMKFLLILEILLGPAVTDIFAVENKRPADSEPQETTQGQACNFNEESRIYSIEDFLLCMNEEAAMFLLQQNANQNRISDRVYHDTRQSHPSYAFAPDYSIPSNGVASSNYYAAQTISSLVSGGLPLPSLPNLFDFNSFAKPNFNLFAALSSITKYDDLKCIPRILCEAASGSIPGSTGYRQRSISQDLGINSLIRFLTSFEASPNSPVLSFARAGLIGYLNKGKPHLCYREYPRCPQNPEQLILYLNNYNGGFFRFFGNHNNGNFYGHHQSVYYKYNRNSAPPNEDKQSNPQYVPPTIFTEPEADRTGTGKVTFDNYDTYYQEQDNSDINIGPLKRRESESTKIIFPKNRRESQSQLYRVAKSFNVIDALSVNNNQKEPLQTETEFFPEEDNQQNVNVDYSNHYNQNPPMDMFENARSNGYYSRGTFYKDILTYAIPNNKINHRE